MTDNRDARAEIWIAAADGSRLHVATAGAEGGVPIILLHGFPDSCRGWRRQMEPLAAAGLRVLAPDLRGYGASDCPRGAAAYALEILVGDVLAIMPETPVHLVGHDWGGIIAWAVAAWHPERVRALTIVNAPHLDTVGMVMRHDRRQMIRSTYVALFQLPGLSEVLLRLGDFRLLERMVRATALANTFTAEDFAAYRLDWAQPHRLTAMLNVYRALVRIGHPPIGRIAVPTQILWGMRDAALSFAFAEAALALCDDGRLRTFPEASHWLQLDQPEAVADALIAFHRA